MPSTSSLAPGPKPFASAKIFAKNFPSIGIRIGNSPDPLYLLLDTGSADMWINPGKIKHPSTTSHKIPQQFSIFYGTGNVSGHIYDDELHVGLLNQLDLRPARQVGIGDIHVSPELNDWGGIIGMSLYKPDQLTYPGGWEMLSPNLTPRVFGLRMQAPRTSSDSNAVEPASAGQVDWGAPDPRYVRLGITYVNVPTDKLMSAWFINTDDVFVNGRSTGFGRRLAHLDTGSTGINLFPGDAEKLNRALGGIPVPHQPNTWALPCSINNAQENLQIGIGRNLFGIPNYLLLNGQMDFDPNFCSSWIQGTAKAEWTLGSGFLQAVYSVWDYEKKRVGFASVQPLTPSSTSS
ncbi:MAG: hypothetical protein Q9162_002990 [Coniocarpon cinnabarinum]